MGATREDRNLIQEDDLGANTICESPDIRERTIRYAIRAIELFRFVQKGRDGAGRIIAKQYLRAATSIGANVEEAHSGKSRADFIHKLGIAQKESRECSYWLRLMADTAIVTSRRLAPIRRETEEIYPVLTAIIVNTKRKTKSQVDIRGS